MIFEYAIIVKNKTRLESLIERFNTKAQAKFYIERMGGDFKDYEVEHERFHASLSLIQTQLSKLIKNKTLERSFLPNYIFSEQQLIIVIGQDGLVANTAKYAKNCPIIAINPDAERYDGVLLPFQPSNYINGVEQVLKGNAIIKEARLAQATLKDGQRLLAFNDLFVGASSHVSARYRISYNSVSEDQSSSGVIVSTAAGATGWLSSVFNMAQGVANLTRSKGTSLSRPKLSNEELLFAVREPFKSARTQTGLTIGKLTNSATLIIESRMPSGGVIFSDGIESDFLHFNSGSIVRIGLAAETAHLVMRTTG